MNKTLIELMNKNYKSIDLSKSLNILIFAIASVKYYFLALWLIDSNCRNSSSIRK